MRVSVLRASGGELRLEGLDASSPLALLRQRVEEAWAVPSACQCLVLEGSLLPGCDANASLESLGIVDGTRLDLVCAAWPVGKFEHYSKVPSMLLDEDDDFECAEQLHLEVGGGGEVSLRFRGQYDLGRHERNFAGAVRAASGGGAFLAELSCSGALVLPALGPDDEERALRRIRIRSGRYRVHVRQRDDGDHDEVELEAAETCVDAPFSDGRSWRLRRVDQWQHDWA